VLWLVALADLEITVFLVFRAAVYIRGVSIKTNKLSEILQCLKSYVVLENVIAS
jgi:hypothetical protein